MKLNTLSVLAACLIAVTFLSMCSRPDAQGRYGKVPDERRKFIVAYGKDGATLRAFLSGTTYKSYSKAHGTQVEFLSADGGAFLWYPSNRVLVVGRWETRDFDSPYSPNICFKYGSNTYNPVTKTVGGNWTCRHGRGFILQANGIVRNDIFGLQSGSIPFVMPKGPKFSFPSLLKKAGKASRLEYIWKYR